MTRYLLWIFLATSLVSCSLERKLAREYVRDHHSEGIMLSPAEYIYKDNLGAFIDIQKYPGRLQQDSVAFFSSQFVQHVSDSIFLTLFTNSLIEELEAFGYHVTLDQAADQFLSSHNPSWIVQLSQMQLEEDYNPEVVYGYDDEDQEYVQEYKVNTISLNSWTEVSPINSGKGARQMLFLSGYISDDAGQYVTLEYYNGQFYLNDYRYTIDLDDIYGMAINSGKKHAELLTDYFMNDYIRRNMNSSKAVRKEMHYNRKLNKISAGLLERFEVIP